MEGEFQDWELLNVSDSEGLRDGGKSDGIEGDSEGMIRSDYFSIDNQSRYAKSVVAVSEEGSVETDNPSLVDSGSETRYERKNSDGVLSDSGSDRSDDRKIGDLEVRNELVFDGSDRDQVGIEGIGGIEEKSGKLGEIEFDGSKSSDFDVKNELGFDENAESKLISEGSDEIQVLDNEDGSVSMNIGDAEKEIDLADLENRTAGLESSGEFNGGNDMSASIEGAEGNAESKEIESSSVNSVGNVKRSVVWWKVPLEVLKFCMFKVSPVWSVSVAAAMMGLVILGRRWYRMKQKRKSLQLKVTVDDKKVSQFMSRAARLNEAFSVVRRVPIVRPALPAGGVNPWPVVSIIR